MDMNMCELLSVIGEIQDITELYEFTDEMKVKLIRKLVEDVENSTINGIYNRWRVTHTSTFT